MTKLLALNLSSDICFKSLLIDTSSVQGIPTANTEDTVYNLQGVRLNKAQQGVNIINGKKVLVK